MAEIYTCKTGDEVTVEATLENKSGAVNLKEAEKIELWMSSGGTTLKIVSEKGAPEGEHGAVKTKLTSTDTANAGTYKVEYKVKWKAGVGGGTESFPSSETDTVKIEESV